MRTVSNIQKYFSKIWISVSFIMICSIFSPAVSFSKNTIVPNKKKVPDGLMKYKKPLPSQKKKPQPLKINVDTILSASQNPSTENNNINIDGDLQLISEISERNGELKVRISNAENELKSLQRMEGEKLSEYVLKKKHLESTLLKFKSLKLENDLKLNEIQSK